MRESRQKHIKLWQMKGLQRPLCPPKDLHTDQLLCGQEGTLCCDVRLLFPKSICTRVICPTSSLTAATVVHGV